MSIRGVATWRIKETQGSVNVEQCKIILDFLQMRIIEIVMKISMFLLMDLIVKLNLLTPFSILLSGGPFTPFLFASEPLEPPKL